MIVVCYCINYAKDLTAYDSYVCTFVNCDCSCNFTVACTFDFYTVIYSYNCRVPYTECFNAALNSYFAIKCYVCATEY